MTLMGTSFLRQLKSKESTQTLKKNARKPNNATQQMENVAKNQTKVCFFQHFLCFFFIFRCPPKTEKKQTAHKTFPFQNPQR